MSDMTPPGPCITAPGKRYENGYGRVCRDRQVLRAHRVAYEDAHGPIPQGMVIDHNCHNADLSCPGGFTCEHRACINPDHLEAVTDAENRRRGRVNALKTACPYGHPYDDSNTHVETLPSGRTARRCLTCRRARDVIRGSGRRRAAA